MENDEIETILKSLIKIMETPNTAIHLKFNMKDGTSINLVKRERVFL